MGAPRGAGAADVRKGLLITTIGGLLFTLDLPLLRLAGLDQWTLVAARGTFLFISISLVWLLLRRSGISNAPFIAGLAGIAVAITNTVAPIAYIGAIKETSAANVVFIMALIPVITAFLSRIFIGEKVHGYTWTATGFALAGVSIIVWDGFGQGHLSGDLLALLSAFCTGAAFTIIRASGKNVATSLAVGSLTSALVAMAFFQVSPQSLFDGAAFGMPAWVWLALNGLVAIPLAIALIASGPRFLPSTDVSMFFLLETVLTPVWIWLLFGETPTLNALIGGGIVMVTLLAHSWWRLKLTLSEGISLGDVPP
jgi:drug/metabolite transporter (DMT)-like permease